MHVRRHSSISEFLALNEENLLQEEAVNNLLLGLSYNLRNNPYFYGSESPFMCSVFDQHKPIFCCLQTPPRLLQVAAFHKTKPTCIEFLCDNLIRDGLEFPGVTGESDTSEEFALYWSKKNKTSLETKLNMMVHRLDRLTPISYASGLFRKAESSDQELIANWIYRFAFEIFEPKTKEGALQDAQKRIEQGELFVWEDGELCSMAASSRPTKNGISVNLVYTPKALRGRGYARSCVAALSKHLLQEYSFCTLFTDLNNSTSNHIYRKIGYQPLQKFKSYLFKEKEKM